MELFGKKLVSCKPDKIGFYCVGCDDLHLIPVNGRVIPDKYWRFNGKKDKPSFYPGFRLTCIEAKDPHGEPCECAITRGFITYGKTCAHDYAGVKLDLLEIPPHIIEAYEIGKPVKLPRSIMSTPVLFNLDLCTESAVLCDWMQFAARLLPVRA